MNLLLFDVDGTLAKSTLKITDNMENMLKTFSKKDDYEMSIVGGGTYEHIIYQIGKENEKLFTNIFSENGLVTYKDGFLFHKNDIRNELGEKLITKIINFTLRYIADLELPCKRGSFIRFRNGMMYITPIGGDCSMNERSNFAKYDSKYGIREKMINTLLLEFKDYNIDVKMGGQIGIGLHPKGWDKSYVLQFINIDEYENIYFFGDRCTQNGNDFPLYSNKNIKGNHVESPEHTFTLLNNLI